MMRHHYVEAEVIWAARWGWARTVGDVLSRRTRALLLNTRAALDIAPRVAEFLGTELGRDTSWRRRGRRSSTHSHPPICHENHSRRQLSALRRIWQQVMG